MDFIIMAKRFAYVVLVLLITWIAKYVFDKITATVDEDDEIVNKSNLALGFRRAGFYLGGMIAMAGVLSGPTHGFIRDVTGIAVFGFIAYALLLAAWKINDAIILKDVCNDTACKSGNIAVGITECGSLLAAGIIMNGCVSGSSNDALHGIAAMGAFFALGQLMLLALVYVYEKITPFESIKSVEEGNAAAGLALAGKLVAFGIVLRIAITGEFSGWASGIIAFFGTAVAGILFLLAASVVTGKMFLPNSSENKEVASDRNAAAVMLTQFVLVGAAIIVSMVI